MIGAHIIGVKILNEMTEHEILNPIPPARVRISLPRANGKLPVTWRQFGMSKKTTCTKKSKRLSLLQVAFCLKYSSCSTQRTKRRVVNFNEVHVLRRRLLPRVTARMSDDSA